MFEGKIIPPLVVATKVDAFSRAYGVMSTSRQSSELINDKIVSRAFFYGACKGEKCICGLGFVLYLSNYVYFSFKANAGPVTNNQGELLALYYLLKLALDRGMKWLTIMGDSLLVVNWVLGLA